jgi:hypothetical protein
MELEVELSRCREVIRLRGGLEYAQDVLEGLGRGPRRHEGVDGEG